VLRFAAICLAASLFVGCQGSQDRDSNQGTAGVSSGTIELRIAVIPKATSLQYWKAVHAGAEQAARELGNVQIIWKGPAQENNTAGQIEVVRNMITQRVDGICLAPNHSESLVAAVQEANDESIPVVIFDSGVGEGAEIVSYVATDNREGGRLAARRLAETIDGQGEVILLRYRAGSESTGEREIGFLEEIAKYENIRVISSDQYGEATTKSAMDKATQLLLRYQQELDGIFAVCEPNCHGVLQALEQAGLAGKVHFVAFDPSDMLIQAMKSGHLHGIVLQDPRQIGYLAVKTLVAHLQGETVDARISTGEYVATPENMESARIQELLHPELFGE
jgi:ribose transport system substrate-binding protein